MDVLHLRGKRCKLGFRLKTNRVNVKSELEHSRFSCSFLASLQAEEKEEEISLFDLAKND